MGTAQAFLYLLAIVLLFVAAFVRPPRVSLGMLGAAAALAGYALPVIATH